MLLAAGITVATTAVFSYNTLGHKKCFPWLNLDLSFGLVWKR